MNMNYVSVSALIGRHVPSDFGTQLKRAWYELAEGIVPMNSYEEYRLAAKTIQNSLPEGWKVRILPGGAIDAWYDLSNGKLLYQIYINGKISSRILPAS